MKKESLHNMKSLMSFNTIRRILPLGGCGILFLFAFVACTSDEDGTSDNRLPITFSCSEDGVTRAEVSLSEFISDFKVYGINGDISGSGNAATFTKKNTVFPDYQVWHTENLANTTSTNTANWEYVGTVEGAYGSEEQTIKYWDEKHDGHYFWAIGDFSKYSVFGIINESPDAVIFDELGMISRNKDSRRLRKKHGHKEKKNETFIYNDIDTILDAGINVYASANLKRFESANPVFKEITGIGVKTKVPDEYLEKADKIIFIDREPDLMIADYEDGKLFVDKYMKSKIMQKNFLPETLTKYREASLKYLEQYGDKVEVVFRSGEGKELKDEEQED